MNQIFRSSILYLNRAIFKRPTPAELMVAEVLLRGEDDRYKRLFLQFAKAKGLRRKIRAPNEIVISVPFIDEDYWVSSLQGEFQSDWLTVADLSTGKELRFSVHIKMGVVTSVVGVCAQGLQWPLKWNVDAVHLRRSAEKYLRLPPEVTQEAARAFQELLLHWNVVLPTADFVFFPPATIEQLGALEERIGNGLPKMLVDLFKCSNGFQFRGIRFGGTEELSILSNDEFQRRLVLLSYSEEKQITVDLDSHEIVVFSENESEHARDFPDFGAYLRSLAVA